MASFQSAYSYTEIDSSDVESTSTDEKVRHSSKKAAKTLRRRLYACVAVIAAVIFAASSGFAMGTIFSPRLQSGHAGSRLRLSCGNSSTEAEALGCTFDPLTVAWLHKDCPRDGTEEFLSYRQGKEWHYWYDEEGLHHIPDYEAMSRIPPGQVYYTRSIEHLVHCTFMAVRSARVRHRGDRIDALVANAHHSEHCAKYLLSKVSTSKQELNILEAGNVGFLHC